MYNEEDYIERCLVSLLDQDYPRDRYEIIVVDGGSTDKSVEIVQDYIDRAVQVRVVNNREKILAAGWNKGIREAKGSIVIRPDAHSYVSRDFITKSVSTLNEVDDAVCVGGRLNSVHKDGLIPEAIAAVLSSRFGVGNSRFRVSEKAGYVDTVAYGAYRKEIFDRVGYFNTSLKRNQDLEMHSRIKDVGGKFYFNPDIKSYYYTRDTIRGFTKQAFGNGYWNIITLKWAKRALSLRHVIPLFFLLSVLFNISVSFFWVSGTYILGLEMAIYFLLNSISALKTGMKKGWHLVVPSILLSFVLHISYGLGSLVAILSLPFYKEVY
jgi:cellulose synthase/poly-beta-1,6-N-acetylglucosamine synthase-like glycosyltransferase